MRSIRRYIGRSRAVVLCLVLIMSFPASGVVSAEGEEAAITNALLSSGISVTAVSISGSEVTVEYQQPAAEVNSVIDVLLKVGSILSTVSAEMPSAQSVVVVQYFDDGQIMEITGAPQDGVAFMNKQTSAEEFMGALSFRPLTRGPIMVPGECEPGKGENCENCPECACYPGETCDPGNPQANERGCVPGAAPANSHLVGSEYVCNDGYEWNSDLSACVPVQQCPPHAFSFQGECHCEAGYEWNSSGTECLPVQSSGQTGDGSGGGVLEKLKSLIDSIVNWIKSLFK